MELSWVSNRLQRVLDLPYQPWEYQDENLKSPEVNVITSNEIDSAETKLIKASELCKVKDSLNLLENKSNIIRCQRRVQESSADYWMTTISPITYSSKWRIEYAYRSVFRTKGRHFVKKIRLRIKGSTFIATRSTTITRVTSRQWLAMKVQFTWKTYRVDRKISKIQTEELYI